MANATFQPLVTDYTVDWVSQDEIGETPEGVTIDHGYIRLPNGYTVSVLRANMPQHTTLGYDEGNWEVMIGKNPAGDFLAQLLGLEFAPAPELDHLHKDTVDGLAISGNLDSAGVTAFVASVAQQPAVTA